MNVLVINAGSSSLKYQLIIVETHTLMAKGICERVGSAQAFHKHGLDDNEVVIDAKMADHDDAMALVLDSLVSGEDAAISSLSEIDAVGHRIVQGGKYFDRSVLIDDDVIAKIDELAELAPLHNGAALMGIRACQKHMPGIPMVAVFDTSFFQTLPPKAYMYPLPYEMYEKYAIRKYGAHGTSHRYISERAAVVLDEPLEDLKLITLHLGIGCRKGTSKEAISGAVEAVLSENQIDRKAVKCCASIDLKAQEAGLLDFCREAGLPVEFYSAEQLNAVPGDFTPSAFVRSVTGVDNVCERAALLGAETLIIKKTARDGVTVSLAAEHWEVSF